MRRRTFAATTAGLGITLVAGCSGSGGDGSGNEDGEDGDIDDDGTGSTGGDSTVTGSFELMISDQPAAIEDFDSLNVSFRSARVFYDNGDDTDGDDSQKPAANETTDGDETEQSGTEATAESGEDEQEGEAVDGEEAFRTISLLGTTVDLTNVVGNKAIDIFKGELPVDTYNKIEIDITGVEGMVNGEEVAVMVPSEKVQIVEPFDLTADKTTSFVFDMNVVERANGYNLLPVFSGSGVVGRDVEIEEIDRVR